jgi:hypothetical protein
MKGKLQAKDHAAPTQLNTCIQNFKLNVIPTLNHK